jgi:ATP-dependent exoDNAse (exonuclease V) beta subunit
MMLDKINSHPRDSHIVFEPKTHTYTIDGCSDYKSVTTWIHEFFPAFDSQAVISKMKAGKNWGPDNKYYGMSNSEIQTAWKKNGTEAAALGTAMHENIENYYNGLPIDKNFKKTPEYKLFRKYLSDHKAYQAYRTEWTVYSKVYRLAGSIDMVYKDPKDPNKLIIADWKRCKEIRFSNKWEKGLGALSDIDNCNYWHYCLQLNVYRMILEKYYGKTISEMFLVVLHPDQKEYQKIVVPRVTKPIISMVVDRKKLKQP